MLLYLQQSDPDWRRFLCSQGAKPPAAAILLQLSAACHKPSLQASKDPDNQQGDSGPLLIPCGKPGQKVSLRHSYQLPLVQKCTLSQWLTVLRQFVLTRLLITCNQLEKNHNWVCTEQVTKEILERHKVCHILKPQGPSLSMLTADHPPLLDYSCSLPAFYTTSSYSLASSCTETLPKYLYSLFLL